MTDSEIFLAPCSRQGGNSRAYRHLLDTVVGGVNLDTCSASTKRSGEVSVWGLTDGNKNRWDAIEPGDYLFFYVGDGLYEYATEVLDKEPNRALAEELWPNYGAGDVGGDDPGDPWTYIVYLGSPVRINLDAKDVHDPAGHKQRYTQRFMRLNEQGREALIADAGSVEAFISEASGTEWLECVEAAQCFSERRFHRASC